MAVNGDKKTLDDLQTYPILTEEISFPSGAPTPSTGAPGVGGTSSLGQAAQQAIRDVLGWKPKTSDPKGFVAALTQAFVGKEVEGHTEWSWKPRNYAVQIQADLGAVTGAQASIYTRAKVAIDQVLPLLDGLTALRVDIVPEDQESVRAIVRDELPQLVDELGAVAGPRIQRVNEFFHLLLFSPGQSHEVDVLLRHPERVGGQLGEIRDRFGLTLDNINTIDDEQNVTNFLIVVDYVTTLYATWTAQKKYFNRVPQPGVEPYFGTQLVLLSRSLAVVAESVQEVYFALDSVFLGPAERQAILLQFKDGSSLFAAELFDWVDRATTEGLALIQDGGKDGVSAFVPTLERVTTYVAEAAEIARHPKPPIVPADEVVAAVAARLTAEAESAAAAHREPDGAPAPAAAGPVAAPHPHHHPSKIPPGFHTPRVVRALEELTKQLREALSFAVPIRRTLPPEVQAVQPNSVRIDDVEGCELHVYGANFQPHAWLQLWYNHEPLTGKLSANVVNSSELYVDLPALTIHAHLPVAVSIVVTNPDQGTSAPAPVLTIKPASAGTSGPVAATAAKPQVASISGMKGSKADTNPVTVELKGTNLGAIAGAWLTRPGQESVPGTLEPVPEEATSRTITFAMTGKETGTWQLVMTTTRNDLVTVSTPFELGD
jgi:hypothetical protein